MRVRRMCPGDRPALVAVYEARGQTAAGPMRRNPAYWRRRTRGRGGLVRLVAEERGSIVGYALASVDDGVATIREVTWRPEFDGTDIGERLLRAALQAVGRRRPCAVNANAMEGSPFLPAARAVIGHKEPIVSLFMAAPLDPRRLLRDAVRVVEARVQHAVRLRIGGQRAVAGRGPPAATIALAPNVLLGLLLGVRDFPRELRERRVVVAPRTPRARDAARAAFPPRRFWIADSW